MPEQIPGFLRQMLVGQYGQDTAARIMEGYAARRPVTLRINTLKTNAAAVRRKLETAGIGYETVHWNQDALVLQGVREPEIRSLDVYENGWIYLQSLSSMIPPVLLEPKPKECILDMAAAPGGKTTQLAALSGGQAQITACEKNFARTQRLRYNLEKQGASGVLVMNEDARKLDPFFSFDKILLDAPCSGSGTLQIPFAGKKEITVELISRSAKTQAALLKKALELLKPGHEMVYSTCSVLREENEQVLKKVLSGTKAEIIPVEHPMKEEIPLLPTEIRGTMCICPTDLYEGFFVAKIRRL